MSATQQDMSQLNDPRLEQPVYDDEIDLRELIGVLKAGWKLIAAFTVAALVLGLTYAMVAPPVYEADALLQVEEQSGSLLPSDELAGLFGAPSAAETEIQVIKSRYVVGRAVERLNLQVAVTPKRFPLFGDVLARRYSDEGPAEAWLGLESYAWGGERIEVPRFEVPREYEGLEFTLVAQDNERFLLIGPEGERVLEGAVGQEAMSGDGSFGLFVAELEARPNTEFSLVKRPWLSVVNGLQSGLKLGEQGKQTGVIRASLEGNDRRQTQDILDAVTQAYLRQNVERRSAQAEESLKFLEGQLPELRANLEAAEERLSAYRQENRAVDLGAEAGAILNQLVDVESQIAQLELKRSELARGFKPNHPAMLALDEQKAKLESIKARLERDIGGLPETQQEILRLSRELEVNTQLYTALLNHAQELRVVKAGTVGNARILDPAAVKPQPVAPKKGLILALSLVLGGMLGVLTVFGRHMLRSAIGDPDEIERELGLSVYAAVPYTTAQRTYRRNKPRAGVHKLPLLAAEYPQDLAVESLRSFRTSMHFAMLGAKSNRIVISGPAPGIGKSFVAVNSAYLLGESGKKTLLIDADMRRGYLHEYTGASRDPGLSDVLSGSAAWQQAVRPLSDNCDLLAAGTVPPNPSELLMSEGVDKLLEAVSAEYDYVIIDTPPILAVTDAALIAAKTDAVFLVARAGETEMGELELAVKRLRQNKAAVSGVVVNALTKSTTSNYGNYRYYQYEYRSQA